MKFKTNYLLLGLLFSLASCEADYVNNSRVFVEGKITSQSQSANGIPVALTTWLYPISQGTTKNDGSFSLGGPDVAHDVKLTLGKKIVSFSTDSKDCSLDIDSLSIILPENLESVKFSNITIE
ncbi:hypothetical protein [Epilithonimonas hispanica]|uniref:Carboxypeptidase regulatory-like domain-containing protein n=1 Tax=Epilithonimonas hispanica TaxID=358687 RepID=A0A3D9D2Z3_9FLAO|nr:hypothetical protein [Epilithonimonas hispanica]REC72307.1 hypothetical protein DRF58_03360 [Epilithonimonas hispanica]